MPRKRTGTTQRSADGTLRARITVDTRDGQRRLWFDLDPSLTDAQAQKAAQALSDRFEGQVLTPYQVAVLDGSKREPLKTVRQFYLGLYCDLRKLNRPEQSHWRNHILPAIGELNVRTFTSDNLRKLVGELDRKVAAGELSASTARVIWAHARKFSREIMSSKKAALLVRTDDPSAGVQGPDGAPEKSRQWLYPNELRRLLGATTTPLSLARFVAVATYLCCRPSEALGLEWRHFDFDAGMVRIDQRRDPRSLEVGRTKTGDVRSFAIPPLLLPMLRKMRGEADGDGFVFQRAPTPMLLRDALTAAGVTRHELHNSTGESRAIRVHDCRATGITYLAVAGRSDDDIREHAGHRDFETTLGYIRRGKLSAETIGDPFAPLPDRLIASGESSGGGGSSCDGSSESYSPGTFDDPEERRKGPNSVHQDEESGPPDTQGDDSLDDWMMALAESGDRAAVASVLWGKRGGRC